MRSGMPVCQSSFPPYLVDTLCQRIISGENKTGPVILTFIYGKFSNGLHAIIESRQGYTGVAKRLLGVSFQLDCYFILRYQIPTIDLNH